jgi:bla regulator protein blaR1
MMPVIDGAMLAIGSSLAVSIVVKVTVVAALGLAAAWLARRNRAAVRHALLAATFGAALLLQIGSIVAPPVRVAVPVVEVNQAALPLVVGTIEPMPPVTTAADGALVKPATPQASRFSLSALLLAGWIIGTAVFLLPVVTGLWQIRVLRRSGLPWLRGQSAAETLAFDAGVHRRVEVLLHEALPGPITCGVLNPAILLPRDAESWPREDLSRAIVHELEHVRRDDSATRYLARAVCALYWFHPLTWIAWRKLVLEAERSCDDAVLRRSDATACADQLVELAKRLPTAHRSPLLAMANRSDLSARVGAVLDSRQNRGRAGTFPVALACAAAAVLVIAISPLMLVAAPQQAATPTPKFEVASIRACDGAGFAGGRGGGGSGRDSVSPGRVSLACKSLADLIQQAYVDFENGSYHDFRHPLEIKGGPAWKNSDRYAINASAQGDPSPGSMQGPMLQALLEDRFKLKIHRETTQVPAYVLTVAKGGLKLKRVESCTPRTSPPSTPEPGQPPACASGGGRSKGPGQTEVDMRAMTLDEFAGVLSIYADRPVINETGVSGRFDFHMEYTVPDEPTGGAAPGDPMSSPRAAIDPAVGPSPLTVFTANQQQLGLKIESAKGPQGILVIDSAEKPSEN